MSAELERLIKESQMTILYEPAMVRNAMANFFDLTVKEMEAASPSKRMVQLLMKTLQDAYELAPEKTPEMTMRDLIRMLKYADTDDAFLSYYDDRLEGEYHVKATYQAAYFIAAIQAVRNNYTVMQFCSCSVEKVLDCMNEILEANGELIEEIRELRVDLKRFLYRRGCELSEDLTMKDVMSQLNSAITRAYIPGYESAKAYTDQIRHVADMGYRLMVKCPAKFLAPEDEFDTLARYQAAPAEDELILDNGDVPA